MEILDTMTHRHDGQDYEIISLWDGAQWQVFIHDVQKRKVGPSFGMSLEVGQDYQHYNQKPALHMLIEVAKAEIDSGRVKGNTSSAKA